MPQVEGAHLQQPEQQNLRRIYSSFTSLHVLQFDVSTSWREKKTLWRIIPFIVLHKFLAKNISQCNKSIPPQNKLINKNQRGENGGEN